MLDQGVRLRAAVEADDRTIKLMIRYEHLNPMGLDWRRFLVAETLDGTVIGCGQVKVHSDGSRELASLVVLKAWRRRGIASQLIRELIAAHPGDLFLTCRPGLGAFYAKFGFRSLEDDQIPPYFRRIRRLVNMLSVFIPSIGLLIMKWGEEQFKD